MGQQSGLTGMLLPLAMFAAIFYFMIIRPQKKKQRAHEDMLSSISKGDTVVTAGGFFGIVRESLDDSYIIELGEGVKARILKSSVSMKKGDGSPASSQPKKKKSKKSEALVEDNKPEVEETKPAEEAQVLKVAAVDENPDVAVVEEIVVVSENKDEESKKEA